MGEKMNKRILRVFTEKTSCTPEDELVRIGSPDKSTLLLDVDEVHISTVFSWQREKAERLKEEYKEHFKNVNLGGVSYGLCGDRFTSGLYVKKGITITTRGCNMSCPYCLVHKFEGKFREINIEEGNIVQDNNLLLASDAHLNKVFQMLRKQRRVTFKGGIDCRLLKDWHIEEMRSLKIYEIWLALDMDDRAKHFKKVCEKLVKAGFKRNKIRCYVLAGFNEEIQKSEERLEFAYRCGALPYVQVYQEPSANKRFAGERAREDNLFVRRWSRPAIIKSMMKEKK